MSRAGNVVLRVAAKALIFSKSGKVLILREAKSSPEGTRGGLYQLPGGRIEANESFFDGLAREVREETGLAVTPERPLYLGEWYPNIRGTQHHIIATYFVCSVAADTVILSEEHDQFEWIEPEAYVDFKLVPPEDKVIQAYLDRNG